MMPIPTVEESVMGLLSKIFGGSDVISDGIKLIDSFHTSDTELIEAKAKAKSELMSAYAPFKLAQRYLALMFTSVYLLAFLVVTGLTVSGIGSPDQIREILSEFYIGEITFTIVGFYFSGGMIEGAIGAAKKK